jgi:penicillin amidase
MSAAILLLLTAAVARADVTILRDAWGVPHVFTRGPDALVRGAYADGWAQAEDRLFEMDVLRRAATGRLAELLGPDYLLMDEVARRDGFTAGERRTIFARLAARDRRAIEAFRDGVNAYLRTLGRDPARLPFEFGGTSPAPWDVTDTVAVAALEFLVFGASGGQEVLNADVLLDLLTRFPEADARGIFDDLHWIDEPAAPTTIAGTVEDPDQIARFAPPQMDLLRAHAESIRAAAVALRREQGLMGGLGSHGHASNAILVAPRLSASGAPLLLGGPQTGLNVPSLFWEIGLHGGGYDAEGVTGPVGPGVLIGRGRNFAMTITSGILDNVDTFIEQLDPHDPSRYLFRGRSRRFAQRTETIKVAGAADVVVDVRRTVHGPVFFFDAAGGVAFSRRAAFRGRELESAAAITNLGFVRNLADFRRLADRVSVSLNLHYADRAGNIAFFHRGVRPLRPRHTDPRLPLDGRGTMEWRGFVPPRRLPSTINPARGFITNWNNKPIGGWSAGEQRELWGVVDRVQPFADALEAARAAGRLLSLSDVENLTRRVATSDIFAARIVPFLESAVNALPVDPALDAAVAYVRAWVDAGASLEAVPDPNGRIAAPGAAIYTEFRRAVQPAVFADELGTAFRPVYYPAVNAGTQEDDHGSLGSPDALLLRALLAAGPVPGAAAPPGVLPVSRNYFDDVATGTPHGRDEVLVSALASAVATLTARFGTDDQSAWQLPALRESYRDVGAIGPAFGPVTMARENRGSFNLAVDLAPPVRGEIILPPGESGTFTAADLGREPPHVRDQLGPYEAFSYRRQAFTERELEPPVRSERIPFERPAR